MSNQLEVIQNKINTLTVKDVKVNKVKDEKTKQEIEMTRISLTSAEDGTNIRRLPETKAMGLALTREKDGRITKGTLSVMVPRGPDGAFYRAVADAYRLRCFNLLKEQIEQGKIKTGSIPANYGEWKRDEPQDVDKNLLGKIKKLVKTSKKDTAGVKDQTIDIKLNIFWERKPDGTWEQKSGATRFIGLDGEEVPWELLETDFTNKIYKTLHVELDCIQASSMSVLNDGVFPTLYARTVILTAAPETAKMDDVPRDTLDRVKNICEQDPSALAKYAMAMEQENARLRAALEASKQGPSLEPPTAGESSGVPTPPVDEKPDDSNTEVPRPGSSDVKTSRRRPGIARVPETTE